MFPFHLPLWCDKTQTFFVSGSSGLRHGRDRTRVLSKPQSPVPCVGHALSWNSFGIPSHLLPRRTGGANLVQLQSGPSTSQPYGDGRKVLKVAKRLIVAILISTALVAFPCWSEVGEAVKDEEAKYEFPQQLTSSEGGQSEAPLSSLISGKNGKQITDCSRKCIPGCIRGGEGAPGLGPITVRKDMVVFKEGFRSRQYCLSECTQVCALSYNGQPSSKAP